MYDRVTGRMNFWPRNFGGGVTRMNPEETRDQHEEAKFFLRYFDEA